jgi:hypothetical protein
MTPLLGTINIVHCVSFMSPLQGVVFGCCSFLIGDCICFHQSLHFRLKRNATWATCAAYEWMEMIRQRKNVTSSTLLILIGSREWSAFVLKSVINRAKLEGFIRTSIHISPKHSFPSRRDSRPDSSAPVVHEHLCVFGGLGSKLITF